MNIPTWENALNCRTIPRLHEVLNALEQLKADNDIHREFQDSGIFKLIPLIRGMIKRKRKEREVEQTTLFTQTAPQRSL